MRIAALTTAMFLLMDADAQVLLLFLGLLPAAGVVFFVALMLAPAARSGKPQSDTRSWRGTHRTPPTKGRHSPARGRRLRGVSRQAQLEERTVSVDARALLAGLAAQGYLLDEELRTWCTNHVPFRDGSRIRCRTCNLDLPQPDGMPEIGRNGFSSWA